MRILVSLLLIGTLLSGCSLAGRPRPGVDFTLAGVAMVGVAATAGASNHGSCDSDCSAGFGNWDPVPAMLLGATALVFVVSGLKGLAASGDDQPDAELDRNAKTAEIAYQKAWQQEMARRARHRTTVIH